MRLPLVDPLVQNLIYTPFRLSLSAVFLWSVIVCTTYTVKDSMACTVCILSILRYPKTRIGNCRIYIRYDVHITIIIVCCEAHSVLRMHGRYKFFSSRICHCRSVLRLIVVPIDYNDLLHPFALLYFQGKQ